MQRCLTREGLVIAARETEGRATGGTVSGHNRELGVSAPARAPQRRDGSSRIAQLCVCACVLTSCQGFPWSRCSRGRRQLPSPPHCCWVWPKKKAARPTSFASFRLHW